MVLPVILAMTVVESVVVAAMATVTKLVIPNDFK